MWMKWVWEGRRQEAVIRLKINEEKYRFFFYSVVKDWEESGSVSY